MISWLQKNFQQHYRILFMVLLAIVIVMFVFTIGNMPGLGSADREVRVIELFGRPYSTETDRTALQQDAYLSVQLTGQSVLPFGGDFRFIPHHALLRLAALDVAEDLGIPQPTKEQVEAFIKTLPAFSTPDGKYNPDAYATFYDAIKSQPQEEQARISRVLMEDWRIAQVVNALGGPGYVLESEVKKDLVRAETKWTVHTATVDLSSVQAASQPTEEEMQQFFQNNSPRYRAPERTSADFIEFRAADFVNQVQFSEQQLSDYFERNKFRYTPPAPPPAADGTTPPAPPEPTLADVRDRVAADYRQQQAQYLAEKAAADFQYQLYEDKIEPGTEAFARALEAQKLTLQSAPPFSMRQPPEGLNWSGAVLAAAAELDQKQPVSEPIRSGENTVLLFFKERLPGYVPEFAAVRDRVLQDMLAERRQAALDARGRELQQQIQNAVKGGQSFIEAAKAAGLETKSWENFTLRAPPPDADFSVIGQMDTKPQQEVLPMLRAGDRGTFAFIANREEPDIAAIGEAYTKARDEMMKGISKLTAYAQLSEMVERERAAAGIPEDTSG